MIVPTKARNTMDFFINITSFFYCWIPLNLDFGARDWTRTSTGFPPLPPQGSVSTNFTTRALELQIYPAQALKVNSVALHDSYKEAKAYF